MVQLVVKRAKFYAGCSNITTHTGWSMKKNEDTDFAVKVIFYPTPSVFRLCVDGKGEDVGDARSLDVYTTPGKQKSYPSPVVACV